MTYRALTRRDFMAGGAALAALPFATEAATPRVLVDWHSHYVSDAELRFLAQRRKPPMLVTGKDGIRRLQNADTASAEGGAPSDFARSDIGARLAQLDANGIGRQLLTQTVAMGFDATLSLDEQKTLYRAFNDELATVVNAHPNRFLAVAALPSADPVWAAQELARAHRELGFIGGSLPLNAFATLRGARALAPLFAAGQKLGSHFFVHRASASDQVPGQPPVVIPEDTGWARWTLINNTHLAAGGATLGLTDFLDPYPDVTVEIVMLAGFLPYLLDTWVTAGRANGVADPLSRLRRVYFDTGPYATRNAEWVALAAKKLGADRILFGTDYGVGGGTRGDIAPALAGLDNVLDAAQRQAIYLDNSRRLLERHRPGLLTW
jgi:predicted TIM-barrel fold metal-dependent hydrolase